MDVNGQYSFILDAYNISRIIYNKLLTLPVVTSGS